MGRAGIGSAQRSCHASAGRAGHHRQRATFKVARALLYMAQGMFGECSSEMEVQHWMRYNIFLLLDVGAFTALEIEKPAISLADSTDLRITGSPL
ncbi:striatin-interacting protein 1 homolog [Paramisgurnus dabryanus]|uniref:striatin-interacting protein 1 homolog n=1 Tax=Paramisgurnus dabryanus TaxID=90735 RepID=UPI0031F3CC14